jgi:hypothetical protein
MATALDLAMRGRQTPDRPVSAWAAVARREGLRA